MKYSFVGKANVLSDSLKETTIEKMNRLSKFLSEETEITVAYKVTKLENKIEVTFTAFKRPLRAEASSTDMYTAVDQVVDVIEKQLRRLKSRLQDKSKKGRNDSNFIETEEDFVYQSPITITRKSFPVIPMDIEDAIMEMELTGHKFYLFRNPETNEINVIFKGKEENEYGLLDPSL